MNFKKYCTESSTKVVSFDFDSTLANTRMTPNGDYVKDDLGNLIVDGINPGVEQLVWDYHNQGYKIWIITARPATNTNREQVNNFIKEYDLPIEKIYMTNFRPKWVLMKKLQGLIIKHYDDKQEELDGLKKHAPKIEGILIEQ